MRVRYFVSRQSQGELYCIFCMCANSPRLEDAAENKADTIEEKQDEG